MISTTSSLRPILRSNASGYTGGRILDASSFRKVDECLRLVAIRSNGPFKITDGSVAHFLYHVDVDETGCALVRGNPDEMMAEIEQIARTPAFIDLARYNLKHVLGPGPFSLLPPVVALDLALGQVRLVAQFDLEAFF